MVVDFNGIEGRSFRYRSNNRISLSSDIFFYFLFIFLFLYSIKNQDDKIVRLIDEWEPFGPKE